MQSDPYGYIYDDSNRLVVDFSRVARRGLRRFLRKNCVGGLEIPGMALRGVTFLFSRDRVEMHYRPRDGSPSVRVNSRPAGRVTELRDGILLGVGGRLLVFSNSRRAARAAEGMAGGE
jgi:hypothetical protein